MRFCTPEAYFLKHFEANSTRCAGPQIIKAMQKLQKMIRRMPNDGADMRLKDALTARHGAGRDDTGPTPEPCAALAANGSARFIEFEQDVYEFGRVQILWCLHNSLMKQIRTPCCI